MAIIRYSSVRKDIPARIHFGSAPEMRDTAVAFLASDGALCRRFGGEATARAFLTEAWSFRTHYDGVADALDSPHLGEYLLGLNAAMDGRGHTKPGGVTGPDLGFFLGRLGELCRETEPGHYDLPQKISAFGREFVLPGLESLEVTQAVMVNGRPLFFAFERGGMYGNGVYGPEGRLVLGFGPYGSPKVVDVGGMQLLCAREDPYSGTGYRTPLVFRDGFGTEVFRGLEFTVERDRRAGKDVLFLTDTAGGEKRFLAEDISGMLAAARIGDGHRASAVRARRTGALTV